MRSIPVLLLLTIYNLITTQSYFVIPKLHFAMLEPKGFSVCIPDQKGLTRFSFHWNLNKPLGQWSDGDHYSDVVSPYRNMWCYVDTSATLKIGDRIYYWLEVEVQKFGYRMENQVFEVTSTMRFDTTTYDALNDTEVPPFNSPPQDEINVETMFLGGDCSVYPHDSNLTHTDRLNHHSCQLQTHTLQIAELEKVNEELKDKMDYIEQLTSLFLGYMESNSTIPQSNTLLLVGFLPATVSPLHLVNDIVHVQLGFPYKEMMVEQAHRKYDNTIEFRMNSFKSKVRVFIAAKSKLKEKQYQIKDLP